MRLNKNDLAKEFEALTKQEIINHNRQIAESNGRISKIEADLLKKQKSLEVKLAKLDSITSELKSKSKDFEEGNAVFSKEMKSLIENLDAKLESLGVRHEKHLESQNEKYVKKNKFDAFTISYDKEMNEFSNQINFLKKDNSWLTTHLQSQVTGLLERFRYEMSESMPSLERLDQNVLQCVERFNAEKDFVIAEINKIRKEDFVREKQIEYILTRLERIRKQLNPEEDK